MSQFLDFPNSYLPGNIAMEEDRAATNLGRATDVEVSAEHEVAPRAPKKRFIGRRAAAEKAGTTSEPNVAVEDSGAIQGIRCQANFPLLQLMGIQLHALDEQPVL
jgi:hypothetical protein